MAGLGVPELLIVFAVVILVIVVGRNLRNGSDLGKGISALSFSKGNRTGSLLSKRVIAAISVAVIRTLIILFFFGDFSPWHLVNGGILGLILYEIFYRTRAWLNLKTIIFYFALVVLLSSWIYNPLYDLEFGGTFNIEWLSILFSLDHVSRLFEQLIPPYERFEIGLNIELIIVTATIYFLATREESLKLRTDTQHSGTGLITYGGAEMDPSQSQTTRYLASTIVLDSGFRQKVLEMVEHENRALAPELGIDLPKLARLSYLMEEREKRFQIFYFITTVFAVCIPFISPLFILVAAVLRFIKVYQEKYKLIPLLKREDYDSDKLENFLRSKYQIRDLPNRLLKENQNLVVYSGFSPFIGAGFPLGGWTLAIKTSRPRNIMGQTLDVIPFNLTDVYDAIVKKIEKLNLKGFVAKDFLFVNGKEVRDERWILPHIFSKPVVSVDEKYIESHIERNDPLVRHYKWMQVYDWSNEIVVSFFMRIVRRGEYLFFEVNRFVLTPLQEKYRKIDYILPDDRSRIVTLGITSLFIGPFAAILGAFAAIGRLLAKLAEIDIFGQKQKAKEDAIEKDVDFDYGTATSLRTQVSDLFNHFFQKLDQEMYVKVLEKQVVEGMNEFLKDHNIDASDISEQQNTILNAGVIVQGGKINSGAVAVGKGAVASAGEDA